MRTMRVVLVMAAVSLWPAMSGATGTATGTKSVAAGGRVWLEGDSTLHRYGAEAKDFSAKLEVPQEAVFDLAAALRDGKATGLWVNVPVARLSSGEQGLDENLHKTLKAAEHPTISFRMKSYRSVAAANGFDVEAQGELMVAGVRRQVKVTARANPVRGGVRLTGTVPLLMTDYGIVPPVMMLGTIKTRNEVSVRFELLLPQPKSES